MRRRSSSYHSSFIALAKQVRHVRPAAGCHTDPHTTVVHLSDLAVCCHCLPHLSLHCNPGEACKDTMLLIIMPNACRNVARLPNVVCNIWDAYMRSETKCSKRHGRCHSGHCSAHVRIPDVTLPMSQSGKQQHQPLHSRNVAASPQ